MRMLIFHGYLLQGTGSNVYNARLAEALVRSGHEVHLICQDRHPRDLPWVDAEVVLGPDAVVEEVPQGRAVVWRPDIAGVLPVYVPDRYDGVEARPLYEMADAEVELYVERNVAAVRAVAAAARPDLALANHLVMGPLVLARGLADSGTPYAVKIHGSALEYVVKPHPRFLPHAREGLAGASGILVGSRHTGESLWAALEDPSVRERTRLGAPGVDVAAFRPMPAAEGRATLHGLRDRLAAEAREPVQAASAGGSFARTPGEAAEALADIEEGDRLVVYVGKLIGSKGVELLLAAWPLVLAAEPRARLVVVGFGAFRDGLQRLERALSAGDLDGARDTVAEDGRRLPELDAYLERETLPAGGRVLWTGRLDHDELSQLLPAAEAIVVPSTFPEAFGMVAAEGAACGAFPVVARHSGLAEVSEALAAAVPAAVRPRLSFDVGPRAVEDLADCLIGWLRAPEEAREAARAAIVRVTRERWSWDGVARTVLAAAAGELGDLPRP